MTPKVASAGSTPPKVETKNVYTYMYIDTQEKNFNFKTF